MDSWYFAYGSNLWIDQMIARVGAIDRGERRPRIARLANYRLVFQRSEIDGPAYANIIAPGDGVLGVVYRCSPAQLDRLDRFELGYERRPMIVADDQGQKLSAVAYVMRPTQPLKFGIPDVEYLKKIVTGARQYGLPESYLTDIVNAASNE